MSAGGSSREAAWLALYFPALPLEVYQLDLDAATPLAVVAGGTILVCNAAARAAGVRAGMSRLAALAVSAELRTMARQSAREAAVLEQLATWALGFSHQVSLEPPQALVMEAARSLRLFGGAEAFYRKVVESAAALGYQVQACLAPTPGGALLLAAWGCGELLRDLTALRERLALLPPASLGLAARAQADCQRMGLHAIGDLLAQPRAGLRSRLGGASLERLARLLGETPDPRVFLQPADCYHGELELPAEVTDAAALAFACRRLLDELCTQLQARQAAVSALYWTWLHAEGTRTELRLGSARPEADAARWLWLLRERLAAVPLAAPVRAIALETGAFSLRHAVNGDLLDARLVEQDNGADLLDRLRARLGEDGVKTLALADDHRPEQAWRWAEPELAGRAKDRASDIPAGRADRPLWLLPRPLALRFRHGCLWLDAAAATALPGLMQAQPLRFCGGRERIETGWWDAHPVARDYFRVRATSGESFWVYRCLPGDQAWDEALSQSAGTARPALWYLHGAFGA
jgi:protein ImuB